MIQTFKTDYQIRNMISHELVSVCTSLSVKWRFYSQKVCQNDHIWDPIFSASFHTVIIVFQASNLDCV